MSQGDADSSEFLVTDQNGQPVDLTGGWARFALMLGPGAPPLIDWNTVDNSANIAIVGSAPSKVRVSFAAAATQDLAARVYAFEVDTKDAADKPMQSACGFLTLEPSSRSA